MHDNGRRSSHQGSRDQFLRRYAVDATRLVEKIALEPSQSSIMKCSTSIPSPRKINTQSKIHDRFSLQQKRNQSEFLIVFTICDLFTTNGIAIELIHSRARVTFAKINVVEVLAAVSLFAGFNARTKGSSDQ